jgi:hypothetical protein
MNLTNGNLAQAVELYRTLRRRIKELDAEHDKKMEGRRTNLKQLGGMLEEWLRSSNVDSVKTPSGTFYKSTRFTAAVKDAEAFLAYIRENAAWDLIERRANATAVKDYVKKNNSLPPGVNLNQITSVGVRAPKGQAAAGEEVED